MHFVFFGRGASPAGLGPSAKVMRVLARARPHLTHGTHQGTHHGTHGHAAARAAARARRPNRISRALAALLAVWLGATGLAAQAETEAPDGRVKAFYGVLLGTMKQAKALGPKGRYDRLYPVILTTFDVASMTRTASGSGWQTASPPQQAALVDAFSRMMTATYAARFDEFTGESFEVASAVDLPPRNKLVKTRLIQSNGKPVVLNYLMQNAADGWKVADVYLDGTISELAARRAEFAAVMKSGGPDALATLLRQRADKLLAGR
jgi:phospholipid transport system substrate-binding protein